MGVRRDSQDMKGRIGAIRSWLAGNDIQIIRPILIKELLRDLSRSLKRGNEDGVRHENGAGKLVYGLALLAEKDAELVEAILPDVLLEGVDLGLLDLSQDEHLKLRGMQHNGVVHMVPNGAAAV